MKRTLLFTGILHSEWIKKISRRQKNYIKKNLDFTIDNHGICYSIYTKDSDGYIVELTTYDL